MKIRRIIGLLMAGILCIVPFVVSRLTLGWIMCALGAGCALKVMAIEARITRKEVPPEQDPRPMPLREYEHDQRLFKIPEFNRYLWMGVVFLH
jgi:hypothetical protein